ncbi:MAG: hypothetical protein Q4D23_11695 [Bacteroidales bacterium]|nr:hypothetical protein [Bacteroidales bacterium]
MKKILFTLILMLCPALLSAQQAYTTTLVTPPAGMKTIDAMASIETVDFYGHTGQEMLNLVIGSAGGAVYIQGLVSDEPDAWIKGTANATKDVITFAHGQYVGLFFGMLDLYACAYRDGDTAKRCDFVLERDTKSGVMRNRKGINFCTYYYDDYSTSANKYTPEQRYSSIVITPLGDWEPEVGGEEVDPTPTGPVVVPDGVQLLDYTLSATNIRTGHITHPAKLGFDGDDVYLGGFSNVALQTGAYIKGYRQGSRIIFPQDQFITNYSGHEMWLYGTSYRLGDRDLYLENLSFEYEAMTNTYRGEIGLLVADGRAVDGNVMNFSELLQDITLIGVTPDGVSPIATAAATTEVYSLDGRRAATGAATTPATAHRGISIIRTADGTVRKVVR